MMKLSEAILQGSQGMQQWFGGYSHRSPDGSIRAVCALGAAKNAVLGSPDDDDDYGALRACGAHELRVTCPVGEACESGVARYPSLLDEVIVHLNDEHCWSLGKIADWVKSIGA